MIEHENLRSTKVNQRSHQRVVFCSSVPGHETSVTPGGVDVNYAGPSTHGPAPAPSSTGGGGLACLNEQEQARIRASCLSLEQRMLACPVSHWYAKVAERSSQGA